VGQSCAAFGAKGLTEAGGPAPVPGPDTTCPRSRSEPPRRDPPVRPEGDDALKQRATASRALAHQELCQTACKPGSVPSGDGDDHSSGPPVAGRFSRPTRTPRAVNPASKLARRPYSVLLQAGLAMPSLLPGTRWALTPPFHPSLPRGAGGLLSVALSLGSPRAGVTRRLFTVEPGLSSTRAKPPPRPPGRLTRRQMGRMAAGVNHTGDCHGRLW